MLVLNSSMRLTDIVQKIKDMPDLPRDIFLFLLVSLVGAGSFMLGKLSGYEEVRKGELSINTKQQVAQVVNSGLGELNQVGDDSSISKQSSSTAEEAVPKTGKYLGSQRGSVYHLPWCSGAQRIKEENKIWFQSKEEAERKGYRPATNCKGI